MGVQRMGLANAKKKLRRTLSARIAAVTAISTTNCNVPKGHIAVYVGDRGYMKRFIIPITYLNHPLFHDLLALAEQEFGYDHPMGGLTLPCSEDYFTCLISSLSC